LRESDSKYITLYWGSETVEEISVFLLAIALANVTLKEDSPKTVFNFCLYLFLNCGKLWIPRIEKI
jgi:hypothetical protein